MRFATIGTSKIAHQLTRAFLSCENTFLHAVYSRNQARGETFAQGYGNVKVYTELDDLAQDNDIDLVYIASPNSIHYEQVKMMLEAGKHVVCEKPITLTSIQFQKLCACAQRSHRFLFEAITTLHMPNYKVIEKKITEIGNIHLVTCDLSQYSSRYDALKQHTITNVFNPEMGGGALYDLGVYCLHFIVGLFGKPFKIYADEVNYNDIDTSGMILLSYPDMQAVITYGKNTYGAANMKIQSETGYLESIGPCSRLHEVTWHHDGKKENIGIQTKTNHHEYEIQHFLNIINKHDHEEEHRLWEHSRLVYEIIDAIKSGKGTI